jgi:hypothetical protein
MPKTFYSAIAIGPLTHINERAGERIAIAQTNYDKLQRLELTKT